MFVRATPLLAAQRSADTQAALCLVSCRPEREKAETRSRQSPSSRKRRLPRPPLCTLYFRKIVLSFSARANAAAASSLCSLNMARPHCAWNCNAPATEQDANRSVRRSVRAQLERGFCICSLTPGVGGIWRRRTSVNRCISFAESEIPNVRPYTSKRSRIKQRRRSSRRHGRLLCFSDRDVQKTERSLNRKNMIDDATQRPKRM